MSDTAGQDPGGAPKRAKPGQSKPNTPAQPGGADSGSQPAADSSEGSQPTTPAGGAAGGGSQPAADSSEGSQPTPPAGGAAGGGSQPAANSGEGSQPTTPAGGAAGGGSQPAADSGEGSQPTSSPAGSGGTGGDASPPVAAADGGVPDEQMQPVGPMLGDGGVDTGGDTAEPMPDPGNPDAEPACVEGGCGACQQCNIESGKCESVSGRDDADSCSAGHSCSSHGECLQVSESQSDRGSVYERPLTEAAYAQVVSFSESTRIAEIRLEISCDDGDQTFPPVWIADAHSGTPSETTIAQVQVVHQSPTDNHAYAALVLSQVIEEPEAGPFAIVVGASEKHCHLWLNTGTSYPGGSLYAQSSEDSSWEPRDGSMVFQVLAE